MALLVVPALAAENSVILKPSSETPVSDGVFVKLVSGLDLLEGAFNCVSGRGSVIGEVFAGTNESIQW